jgi:uncharacterized protein (TIGR02453 family)
MTDGFRGFSQEGLAFLSGLEQDNSRAFFTANRKIYEEGLKAPMEALLVELAGEFGTGRVYRINRDVRFSADKSPYKTHIAASVGYESGTGSGYYVSVSPDGLFLGAGTYQLSPDQLERFRAAVAAERTGAALEAIVTSLEKDRYEISGEALKSAPRGYPTDHPRIGLLRRKSMTAGRSHAPAKWLQTAAARERVIAAWRAAGPLNAWLAANVGGAADQPRR